MPQTSDLLEKSALIFLYICHREHSLLKLVIKKLSPKINVKNIKKIEFYILPCIDYGSITWGSASSLHFERLNKLQKRAARIILRTDFNTPSQEMFEELGRLPVPNRIDYNKAVLTYRALNNLTPAYITNLLKPMSQVHSLNLRSSENGSLYVPKSRTSQYSGSFTCSAPRLWNALPQSVREAGSLDSFKKNLKNNL